MRTSLFLALVLTGCGSDKDGGGDTGTTPSTGSTTATTGAPTVTTTTGTGTATGTATGTGTGSTFDATAMEGSWSTGNVAPAYDSCGLLYTDVAFTISNATSTSFTLVLDGIPDQLDCDVMGYTWGCLPAFINESVPNMSANLSYTWTMGGLPPAGDTMDVALIVVGECTGTDCGIFMPVSPCHSEFPGMAIR